MLYQRFGKEALNDRNYAISLKTRSKISTRVKLAISIESISTINKKNSPARLGRAGHCVGCEIFANVVSVPLKGAIFDLG